MSLLDNMLNEDKKVEEELYSHRPEDREQVLNDYYGRDKKEFDWVDYGDDADSHDSSGVDNSDDAFLSFLGLIAVVIIFIFLVFH